MSRVSEEGATVNRIASGIAFDCPVRYWNRVYEHAVMKQGWMIVPVPDGYDFPGGAFAAPLPENIGYRFPAPAVLLPQGLQFQWQRRSSAQPTAPSSSAPSDAPSAGDADSSTSRTNQPSD